MLSGKLSKPAAGLIAGLAAMVCLPASAQEAKQILDRVGSVNQTSVLEMTFDDPDRVVDFDILVNDLQANFSDCKLTSTRGLWCIDGTRLINWPDLSDLSISEEILSCEDPAFDLDLKKGATCPELTVDTRGAIYLVGKNVDGPARGQKVDKGKSFALFKVVEKDNGLCPAGFTTLINSPDYCLRTVANGRPAVVDIAAVDGDLASNFNPNCSGCAGSGKGTLTLLEDNSVIFIADDGTVDEVAGGKKDWPIKGNEALQSLSLFQQEDSQGGFDSFVLAVSSEGRVLAADTDGTPDSREIFNIPEQRQATSSLCSSATPVFGIRASSKSGIIYVSDRQFCEVAALQPDPAGGGTLTNLVNVQQNGEDLTLGTADSRGTFEPDSLTQTAGIEVDLSECTESCDLVKDDEGNPAAVLSNVNLVSDEDGLTLFQIQGIPDCRYIPDACVALLDGVNSPADLKSQGIIIDLSGSDAPPAQILNATPLLPQEVRDQFDDDLPDLWVPRWFRGQEANGFLFDALFGITGANFTGVAELEVFVSRLTGRDELGCPTQTPPDNTDLAVLRAYDIAVKASENFISVERSAIPGSGDHEALLVNIGCGSSRNGLDRWSFLPVNLEVTPDTFDSETLQITQDDDAVFAELLDSLAFDLRNALDELACAPADGQAAAPLSGRDCDNFATSVFILRNELEDCLDAAFQSDPQLREAECSEFEDQLADTIGAWEQLTVSGEDPANRIGELGLRLQVIDNVFTNLFFPSIPADGFTN